MKGKFFVKTIESEWKPPFKKNIIETEFDAEKGESFDKIIGNGNDDSVFTVLDSNSAQAKIRYSKLFTVKGYENPKDQILMIERGQEKTISYLWGEKGVTKKIVFKGEI